MAQAGAILLVLASVLMWVSRGRRWWRERWLARAWTCSERRALSAQAREWARRQTGRWTLNAAIVCLVAVGIIDLWLLWRGCPTVTQYVRGILPGWWGIGVMIYALGQTWAVWGVRGLVPAVNAVIWGHLFW